MKDTTKGIDVELAYHFPQNISRQSRDRIARLGALYIVAQVALVLLVFLL